MSSNYYEGLKQLLGPLVELLAVARSRVLVVTFDKLNDLVAKVQRNLVLLIVQNCQAGVQDQRLTRIQGRFWPQVEILLHVVQESSIQIGKVQVVESPEAGSTRRWRLLFGREQLIQIVFVSEGKTRQLEILVVTS